MKDNSSLIIVTYLIYIVLYEALVIGGCAYVVFFLGYSGWWFLLALLFSAGAYKPNRWHSLLTGKSDD